MKLKTLSLFAGAIALTLTATSFAAQAQTVFPSPVLLAQNSQGGLNLSSTQKAEIKQIHQQTWQKINLQLTTSQQSELQTALQARKAAWQARKAQGQTGQQQPGQHKGHRHHRNTLALINHVLTKANDPLTEAEKAAIKPILKQERQDIFNVFTPAQQTQMQQWHQNHQSNNPG